MIRTRTLNWPRRSPCLIRLVLPKYPRCRHVRVERRTFVLSSFPDTLLGHFAIASATSSLLTSAMQYPNYSQSPPSGHNMSSAQPAPIRQQIIDSLFSKIGPDGQREETLITHLKVSEDGGPDTVVGPTDIDGRKTRYLLLAGECFSSA